MLRIVFTKESVKNRVQRDFFESKNLKKINNFRNFLFKKEFIILQMGFYLFLLKHNTKI